MPGCIPASSSSAIPYPIQGYLPSTSPVILHVPSPTFENRDTTTYNQHGLHYETALPVPTCTNTRVSNSITDTRTTVNLSVSSPEKWSGLDTLVDVPNDIQN